MFGNGGDFCAEQICNLPLRQSYRFFLQTHFQIGCAVGRLINYNFPLVHWINRFGSKDANNNVSPPQG
jgi:hypothetical protein